MTKRSITESRMTFGPYDEDLFFHIEKSKTYKNLGDHIKIAEFLLIKNTPDRHIIMIVEAKSSSPNSAPDLNSQCTTCGLPAVPKFNLFITDIREKWLNTLTVGISSCLMRHVSTQQEIPRQFRELDLSSTGFKFVLIIKNHPKKWLIPLRDSLSKAMKTTLKMWAITDNPAVLVLNESMAKTHGLIK